MWFVFSNQTYLGQLDSSLYTMKEVGGHLYRCGEAYFVGWGEIITLVRRHHVVTQWLQR